MKTFHTLPQRAETQRAGSRSKAARGPFLIAFAAAILLLGALISPLVVGDEGVPLTAGYLLVHGQTMYRDFWVGYFPGLFILLKVFFKVFGPGLAVERMVDLGVKSALLAAIYALDRGAGSRRAWLVALLACPLSVVGNSYTMVLAMALDLWALWAWCATIRSRSLAWATLTGVLAAAATFVRWDFGIYLVTALLAVQLAEPSARVGWKALLAAGVSWLALSTVLVLPFFAAAPKAFLDATVLHFFLPNFSKYVRRPLPGLDSLADLGVLLVGGQIRPAFDLWNGFFGLYFPWLVAGILLLSRIRRGPQGQGRILRSHWLALMALFYVQGIQTFGYEHLFPTCAAALWLLVDHWDRNREGRGRSRHFYAALLVPGLVFFAFLPLKLLVRTAWKFDRAAPWPAMLTPADQGEAVAFIQSHTAPDERILVFGGDQCTDSSFYALAQRLPATADIYFSFGVSETPEANRVRQAALAARRYSVVVCQWGGIGHQSPPPGDLEKVGYVKLGEWGRYSVYQPGKMPPSSPRGEGALSTLAFGGA